MQPEILILTPIYAPALDLDVARSGGIVVTNTPDSSADKVADLALGLMLAVMRRICEGYAGAVTILRKCPYT
jgi:phosphoglycerate dehydrogenase-like enzyme